MLPQKQGPKQHKRIPWVRLLIALSLSLLCATGALLLILSTGHIIAFYWYYILPVIFTVISIIIILLQWLFPITSEKKTPALSSLVTLVDASLDPHDSPYEQHIEEGRKIIRLIGQYISGNTFRPGVHHFPTFDFKFQNIGTSTAVLWQYAVNALQINIDQTPSFNFKLLVTDKRLQVVASNNGWGPAHECVIQLHEPTLNRLFSNTVLRYTGAVPSEGDREILLTKELVNKGEFAALSIDIMEYFSQEVIDKLKSLDLSVSDWRADWRKQDFRQWARDLSSRHALRSKTITIQDRRNWLIDYASEAILSIVGTPIKIKLLEFIGGTPSRKDLHLFKMVSDVLTEYVLFGSSTKVIPGISGKRIIPFKTNRQTLTMFDVTWSCKDNENNFYEGKEAISLWDVRTHDVGTIFLTQDGFVHVEALVLTLGVLSSNVTYVTLIDPLRGPQERIYPISRQIPPGDVERFHIIIASQMSCHLLIQFKFFVDQDTILESELFDINIWNPTNSEWHRFYTDGTELVQKNPNSSTLTQDGDGRRQAHVLIELDGKVVGERILNKPSLTIGRVAGNDVQISSPRVSRLHARIYQENGAWVIEDAKSLNGLSHRGQRVDRLVLTNGDRIHFAPTAVLQFVTP